MNNILKIMSVAAVVTMVAGCANQNEEKAPVKIVENAAPSVSVEQVFVEPVIQEATYTSTIQPNIKNNIVPQTAGRIIKINVEVGDHVRKGQVLAEIDKFQLQQAELQLSNIEAELGRLKTLYEAGGLSKSDYEAIELQYNVTKTQVKNLKENTTLLSPVSGVITARNYDVGDMYSMSAPIFTVEQIAPVKLLIGVSESDYTKVKKGQKVSIKAEAFPDMEFEGKIQRIYPTVDPATRTVNVEVKVANSNKKLRPGMFVRVVLNLGTNNNVVIPDVAVVKQQGSGERFVYVLNNDSTVVYQKVELGRRMGAEYEVLSGLKDSATVVTGGQIRLKNGIKVSVNE